MTTTGNSLCLAEKNTGISQINGLDDLYQGRPSKAKNFASQGQGLQEAQLMLTTGSTRLAVSRGQQTWYHSTCYI